MLSALRFHRYRAFDGWTELELRPLTVVFGYNNSGKSTAVRLLPGIADSVTARGGEPLHLEGDVFGEARFADVSHRGGPEIGFEVEWSEAGGGIARARWAVRAELTRGRRWIDSLQVETGDGRSFTLTWTAPGEHFECYTLAASEGELGVGEVEFEGLAAVPGARFPFPTHAAEAYRALAKQIRALADGVCWIGSHRGTVGRSRARPRGRSRARGVRFDAGEAADALAAYHERHGNALMEAVNRVYGDIGRSEPVDATAEESPDPEPIHQLALDFSLDERYALRLSRAGGASPYAPNLADAGEGMTQVLPVAVALARIAAGTPDSPRVLCVEQPELHLHPRAQQALAEHLVACAMAEPDRRLLVETHANHMMLAIQVALAEKRLAPESVLVYWARQSPSGDSRLERVELDALGRDTSGRWPPDVFGDDARMARRLIRARQSATRTTR